MAFDLERFVTAQDPLFERVIAELANGQKTSHWMWFVFPQLTGLGTSAMSQRYALSGLEEAEAYLTHPVLGPRLLMAMAMMMAGRPKSAEGILGAVDAAKLRSSMTLFAAVADNDSTFARVLEKYFGGKPDQKTLDLLARHTA